MPGQRAATHTVEVMVETTFATHSAPAFAAGAQKIDGYAVSQVAERSALEQGANRQDLGTHAPGQGYSFPDGNLTVTCAVQGAGGTGYPAPLTAAVNGQAQAMSSVFGSDATAASRLSTGDTVQAVPAPASTAFDEGTQDNHGADQIIAVADASGNFHARPIFAYGTGASGGNNESIDLAIQLPFTPAVGASLPGAVNLEWTDGDSAALTTVQAEVLGLSNADNFRHLGMVGSCSMPEKAINEVPELVFNWRVATFNDLFAATRTPHIVPLPYTAGGGEFMIAARTGSAGAIPTYLTLARVGIDFGADYFVAEDANSESIGIEGWQRNDGTKTTISLTLPQDDTPPAGITSGATSYRESWRYGRTSNDGPDRFQLFFSWGLKQIGRGFSVYFPDVIMDAPPEQAEVDGRRAMKYMFTPLANGDSPRAICAWW